MNRRKRITILSIGVALIVAIIISISVNLSLRFAVFFESPKSAITLEYENIKTDETKENTNFYRITKNPPSGGSGNGMYTWVVYSYGPFHYAKYYGEA